MRFLCLIFYKKIQVKYSIIYIPGTICRLHIKVLEPSCKGFSNKMLTFWIPSAKKYTLADQNNKRNMDFTGCISTSSLKILKKKK